MKLKRIVCILAAALCLASCAGGPRIKISRWDASFPPLSPGYKALEAEAGPSASRDMAMQFAEFKARLRLAELVAGMSIAQAREFLRIYEEESGEIITDRQESLNIIVTAVDTYLSRVELSPTLSGRDDQGNWYAKARAVFTPEWEEQERTRLEPQRTELETQWKEALERARRQMEQIQRDRRAEAAAAERPAHEALDEGVALYNNKQYGQAVSSFRNAVWHWNAVRLNPPSEVYEYLGNAYHKLENYPEARAAYRKALELDPGNINARALLEEVSPAREREWNKRKAAEAKAGADRQAAEAAAQKKAETDRQAAAAAARKKAEADQQAEEAAWKKAERQEAWESYVARSRRNGFGTGLSFYWDSEGGNGFSFLNFNAYFSLLPFISLGAEGFLFAEDYEKGPAYVGVQAGAGLLIPLVSGEDDFEMWAFGDGFISLGNLPYPGLIDQNLIPGFDCGLRFAWDILGCELKYKSFFFTDSRRLHAVSASFIVVDY